MKQIFLTTLMLLAATAGAIAQNDIIIGQYIHNQFAVNPAFAGSREGLTLFGSYRKQWTGIENTPTSILLDGHAPLKNDKITLGLSLYYQTIHQSTNAGAQLSVGYRTKVTDKSWLSFALQPGVSLRSTNWQKVSTTTAGDGAFAEKESSAAPLLGFGVAWYGKKFFIGVSCISFFVSDDFDQRDAEFSPADATYTATAGYLFSLGSDFKLQPSALASYNQQYDITADGTLSLIYKRFLWIDVAYRTNGEAIGGLAVQALKQLRIAYNYEFTIGDLNGYNSGSHEISLQYDFVYKVKATGPKFY